MMEADTNQETRQAASVIVFMLMCSLSNVHYVFFFGYVSLGSTSTGWRKHGMMFILL